jgi:hypothetical protein
VTDYTWPTSLVPSSSEWRFVSNTAAFASPLSGTTRTLGRGGDRWACTLSFNALIQDDRAEMQAFLTRLRGQAHRVVLPDHSYKRRGALTANVLVKGSAQTGVSLACDGATTGVTNALRAGDYVTVENYPYMVVLDASSDGSGNITLTLNRPLVQVPADNATVNLVAPTGRFMLADNTVGWSNAPAGWPRIVSSFTVDFVEDIA